jgi:uncharacterized protein
LRDTTAKIGVLSDTHLTVPDTVLDSILDDVFKDTDLILHAGDIVSLRVLNRLEERNVVAVCGNMDDYEVLGVLPQMRIVPFAGKRIGLMHGWGSKERLAERIQDRFASDKPDLIVFGHSHMPFFGEVNTTLMFNPGAASWNRYSAAGTVGIIEITENAFTATHIPVER